MSVSLSAYEQVNNANHELRSQLFTANERLKEQTAIAATERHLAQDAINWATAKEEEVLRLQVQLRAAMTIAELEMTKKKKSRGRGRRTLQDRAHLR